MVRKQVQSDRNAKSGRDASAPSRAIEYVGERVSSGRYGDVWLYDEALDEFNKLKSRTDETSCRETVTVQRYFDRFAEMGPSAFSAEMFKSQGRFPDLQGKKVQVFGFKAYQFRVYGLVEQHLARSAFVGTTCDPSKKQNKANKQKLEKAAEMSGRVRQ